MVLQLQPRIIYGPIRSRRLGRSLGINLMPCRKKLCSFNCVYCHYGRTQRLTLNAERFADELPSVQQVLDAVEIAVRTSQEFDYITFSGNGEPTMHPAFADIVHGVIDLRDRWRPTARIALLTNSSGLLDDDVREAVGEIDLPVCKLDAGISSTFYAINRPAVGVLFGAILESLMTLNGITVQTLLVNGHPGNTTSEELDAYFAHIRMIQPDMVQVYSLDRPVDYDSIARAPPARLREIAELGAQVTGVPFRAFHAA